MENQNKQSLYLFVSLLILGICIVLTTNLFITPKFSDLAFQKKFYSTGIGFTSETFTFIFDFIFGIIIGLEFILREKNKFCKWSFNLPKFIFLVIPSLFYSFYFAFYLKRNMLWGPTNALVTVTPSGEYLSSLFGLFDMMTYLFTGYIFILCFSKNKMDRGKVRIWYKYIGLLLINSSVIFLVWYFGSDISLMRGISQNYFAGFFFALKIFLVNIVVGIIIGFENFPYRKDVKYTYHLSECSINLVPSLVLGLIILLAGLFVFNVIDQEGITTNTVHINLNLINIYFITNYLEMFSIYFGILLTTGIKIKSQQ